MVASNGGHLLQLPQLLDIRPRAECHCITFEKSDAKSLLADEETTWASCRGQDGHTHN